MRKYLKIMMILGSFCHNIEREKKGVEDEILQRQCQGPTAILLYLYRVHICVSKLNGTIELLQGICTGKN